MQMRTGTHGSAVVEQVAPASSQSSPTCWVVHVPGPQPASGAIEGAPHPPQLVYQRNGGWEQPTRAVMADTTKAFTHIRQA